MYHPLHLGFTLTFCTITTSGYAHVTLHNELRHTATLGDADQTTEQEFADFLKF